MPERLSDEYRRNWGLRAIGARYAYAVGATGRGVKVAIVDTGVAGAPPDVLPRVSPQSIDLVANRMAADRAQRHGAQIATALAAAADGAGLVGVAPGVEILSVRADLDRPCTLDGCLLTARSVARGIDYVVEHGAQVIVLSLASPRPLPTLEPALRRATAAGVVVVASAGNAGQPEAAWPARYATDPRFRGAVVAVGATKEDGHLAGWSNRAGAASAAYVSAPGVRIPVDCSGVRCELVSGTSFATAYVAGAIALLVDAHPGLDRKAALRLLLDSAHDLGAKGADPVNGRGRIDVARAFRLARAAAPYSGVGVALAD